MSRRHPPDVEPGNGASPNGANGVNGTSSNGVHVVNGSNGYAPPPPLMLPMPAPASSEGTGSLDVRGILNAFRRRWFLALSLGLVLAIPAAVATWMVAPAPYEAFAEVQLNSVNQQGLPGTRGTTVPNFEVWKQTVIKRATHPLVLSAASRSAEVSKAAMIREQEPHAIPWLEKELKVQSNGTEYLRIQLEGEYPTEVALIVNAVAKALLSDVDGDLNQERTLRKQNLDGALAKIDASIKARTTELDNMRAALNVDPGEIQRRQSYLIQLRSSLMGNLTQLRIEKLKHMATQQKPAEGKEPAEVDQDYLKALLEPQVIRHPEYQVVDEQVFSVKKKIEDAERFVTQLTDGVDPGHPSLVKAEKKLAGLKTELRTLTADQQKLREKIEKEILAKLPQSDPAGHPLTDDAEWLNHYEQVFETAFKENEKELQVELDKIQAEQADLEQHSSKGALLTREIERDRDRYEQINSEVEKLKFEIENTPELIKISREAEVPHERSAKQKMMLSGVAGFGVFGVLVGGIVFLEYRTRRVGAISEVTDKLNLRVMGAVPLIPRSAARGNSVKKKARNAIWYSALTESIDSTRTVLIRGARTEPLQTVMIASAMGGEGKTTLSSHLATSLARGGRRILLIDCDLRRPCIHKAFDLPLSRGVCEILRGEATVEDCIQEVASPAGLSILPAGKINQQVLKLLALDSLGDVIEPLRSEYDFIIIDSSPLLPVTDGLLIAHHADGVILAIRRDVSRLGKVLQACQKLNMLGIPLLGAVTIGLQGEGGYQSKYGYNYYNYGHRPQYYTQPPPA